ncbi:hypothetical protein AXG93_1913s2000 [Marchantia polymorpha subsp. ruderalis]|uniref:Uncharacterized protein n=1 Tax=Marchantia polymorpha subsp. ruderalis TaxID=1480154 RepID=A0A176WIQ8_MARPO|nr:hypothetical protein AXG93_1913s2000 [Marchantia polymorpha subsp. ruderalis]
MRPVEIRVPSEVSIEVPAHISAEPLKEETELVSPISLSSERTRSAQGEGTSQMKMNEDLEKEFTLSEEILEKVVARVGGTAVEAEGITLPTSPVEEVRTEEVEKTLGEDVKTLEIKREWEFATALMREREAQLREKETKCTILELNLEKESGRCAELEETCGELRISNENA